MYLNAHSQTQVCALGFSFLKSCADVLMEGHVWKLSCRFSWNTVLLTVVKGCSACSSITAVVLSYGSSYCINENYIKLLFGCLSSLGHDGFCSNRVIQSYLKSFRFLDPLIVRWCRRLVMQICRLFSFHLQNDKKKVFHPQIWYLLSYHHSHLMFKIVFTASFKRSKFLFRLFIDPHDSPTRWLLRWSHPWPSSRWRPLRGGRHSPATSFCLFKCDVRYSRRLTWNLFPGSALLFEKHLVKTDPLDDKLKLLCFRTLPDEQAGWVSECISYMDLFMWIWKISTFSPDLAVTWGFCPNDTFLFVHQSACFMNVLQWTVFVSLLEKKKNCPRISKAKQRPSPAEFSM